MYEGELIKKSTILSFTKESTFFNFLKELEAATVWIDANDNVTFEILQETSMPSPILLSSIDQWEENKKEHGMGLTLYDIKDKAYKSAVVNTYVTPLSANERAGAKCLLTQKYLGEAPEKYAALITDGIRTFGKDLRILVRGGQVMALHTNKYAVLPQETIFTMSLKEMKDHFHESKFISGSYDHDVTHASVAICDGNAEFMNAYSEAWKTAGLPEKMLEKTFPIIDFSTSDTGRYTFTIRPILKIGKNVYPLGSEVLTKHNGRACLDDIGKNIGICFSEMQENLASLVELQKMELIHPNAVFVRACEKVGLSKKIKTILRDALDDFKANYADDETVTAFSVYREICDIQDKIAFKDLSPASILQCLEMFSRLLKLDWQDLDRSGVEEFC